MKFPCLNSSNGWEHTVSGTDQLLAAAAAAAAFRAGCVRARLCVLRRPEGFRLEGLWREKSRFRTQAEAEERDVCTFMG